VSEQSYRDERRRESPMPPEEFRKSETCQVISQIIVRRLLKELREDREQLPRREEAAGEHRIIT